MKLSELKKGDMVICRSSAVIDENTYQKIGGHIQFEKPVTVKDILKNGIRSKERGFIHRNNILEKVIA